MQEIQKYEKILVEAFSVESPETRWSMFAEIVEQIYREIQQEGRSYFYERCLSCYHSGITPRSGNILLT